MRELFDKHGIAVRWFDETTTEAGWFDEDLAGLKTLALDATEQPDSAAFDLATVAPLETFAQETPDSAAFTLSTHAPEQQQPVRVFTGGVLGHVTRKPQRVVHLRLAAQEQPDTAMFRLHVSGVPVLPAPVLFARTLHLQAREAPDTAMFRTEALDIALDEEELLAMLAA